jgi:hypothetical protein
MIQAVADTAPHQDNPLWLVAYLAAGLVLATPATWFAIRRGVWPGILAGIATYVGLGLLGFVANSILVAIYGGGVFGIGFGEAVLLGLMSAFLVPMLLLGLVLAAVLRWRSRRRQSQTTT